MTLKEPESPRVSASQRLSNFRTNPKGLEEAGEVLMKKVNLSEPHALPSAPPRKTKLHKAKD